MQIVPQKKTIIGTNPPQSQHLNNESHVTSRGGDRIKEHHGMTKIKRETGQSDGLKTRGAEQDNANETKTGGRNKHANNNHGAKSKDKDHDMNEGDEGGAAEGG